MLHLLVQVPDLTFASMRVPDRGVGGAKGNGLDAGAVLGYPGAGRQGVDAGFQRHQGDRKRWNLDGGCDLHNHLSLDRWEAR